MESMSQNQESRPPPKASSKPKPKPKPSSPRRPASRAQCLLTPRPYEEIYHERAYLVAYLQQKTNRIEGLIKDYSETEAQLNNGAEGKTRRRLRSRGKRKTRDDGVGRGSGRRDWCDQTEQQTASSRVEELVVCRLCREEEK
ncbi:hypothetical protein NLG97_g3818 [Lecanicillium saksenae]|uniref:Uncharacterized protein n=1 Tax=Lecanicillium saksenae TaxID=468837 RepID=A0ACC1QX00_9HYPO|nr:hypothetical protein NLG97_g3818 [Lecanicillium saksenae]